MQDVRMLGNYVKYLATQKGLTITDLSKIMDCSEDRAYSFVKGRAFVSFPQISSLAEALDVTVENLFTGNEEHYNTSVVHCMNDFNDVRKREEILDLIDSYIDIVDAVDAQ